MPPEKFVVVKTLPLLRAEGIVVLAAGQQNAAKTGADFKRLRRGQAQHRLGQVGFQFVKDRLAPAGGHAARDAFDHAAHGVAGLAHLLDEPDHFLRRLRGRGNGRCWIPRP